MCFEIICIRHITRHISQKFRNHVSKTLFKPYNIGQKDRNHTNKTFSNDSGLICMKMSHSHDYEPLERNCMTQIVSYLHGIDILERLNDSK